MGDTGSLAIGGMLGAVAICCKQELLMVIVGGVFVIEAMSEALAGEVAAFGIKVTIIEPGQFATGFSASVQSPPTIAAYDPIRQAIRSSFKSGDVGDPLATAAAILEAVDANEPPLRLVLGSATIAKFRATYAARLSNWDKWETVSNAAQGNQQA